MKKVLALLMIALVALTGVFANGASEKSESAAVDKTEIKVWTRDRHDAEFWTNKVEKYNQTNTDNIHVTYEIYSDNYEQAVDMAYQTGEAPDIFKFDQMQKKMVAGMLEDLNLHLSAEDRELVKTVITDGYNQIDGKLYFLPFEVSCLRLFYNKTIFDRLGLDAPKTLEEMVECAKTITTQLKGEGIYGIGFNMKSANSGLRRSLDPMLGLATGINLGYDMTTGRYDFIQYKEVLDAWTELWKYSFPGCESLDIDPLRSQFAAGKVGMYMSYTHAEPGVYKNQFPMAEGQKWACIYLPVPRGEIKGGSTFTPNMAYSINALGKNKEAAWKVYKALFMNVENLADHFEQGLGVAALPAVIAVAEMDDDYKNNPALLKSEHDFLYPYTPEVKYSADFLVEGLNYYDTYAEIIAGKVDCATALNDLSKRYNKALDEALKAGNAPIIDKNFSSLN